MNNFNIKDFYEYIVEKKDLYRNKGLDELIKMVRRTQSIIQTYSPDARNKYRYLSHSRDIPALIADIDKVKEPYKKVMEIVLELKYKSDDVRNARRVSNAKTIQEEYEKYNQHFKDCINLFDTFKLADDFKLVKENLEHFHEIYPIDKNSLSLSQALGAYIFLVTSPTRLASSFDYTYISEKDRPKTVEEQIKGVFSENRALQRITPQYVASTVFSSQSAGKSHFKMRLFNSPMRENSSKSVRDFMILSSIGNMTYDTMSYSPMYRILYDVFFTTKKASEIKGEFNIDLEDSDLEIYRKYDPTLSVNASGISIDSFLNGIGTMCQKRILELKDAYIKMRKQEALKSGPQPTTEEEIDNFSYLESDDFNKDFKKSLPFGFQKLIEMNMTDMKAMLDPVEVSSGDSAVLEKTTDAVVEALDSFMVNDDQRRFLNFLKSQVTSSGQPVLKPAIDSYASVVTSITSTHKGSDETASGLQAKCDRKVAEVFNKIFESNVDSNVDVISLINNIRPAILEAYDNTSVKYDPSNGITDRNILATTFLTGLNTSESYTKLVGNLKQFLSDEKTKESAEKTIDALTDASPVKMTMVNSLIDTIFMNSDVLMSVIKEDLKNLIDVLDVPINVEELRNAMKSRPLPKEIQKGVNKSVFNILWDYPQVQDSLKNVLEAVEKGFKDKTFSTFLNELFSQNEQDKELAPYTKTILKLYRDVNASNPQKTHLFEMVSDEVGTATISNREIVNLASFLIQSFIEDAEPVSFSVKATSEIEIPDEAEQEAKNKEITQASTINTETFANIKKAIELSENHVVNSLYTNIGTYIESLPLGDAGLSENIKKLIDSTPQPEDFEYFMVAKQLGLSTEGLKDIITKLNNKVQIDETITDAFLNVRPFNLDEYIKSKAKNPVNPVAPQQTVGESYGFEAFGMLLESASKEDGQASPEQIIKKYLNTLMGFWVKT